MICQAVKNDRRKYIRYKVNGNAFTISSSLNGLITDISLQGLAFNYVERKKKQQEAHRLDIVIDEAGYNLNNLPFKIVAESKTSHNCPDATLVVRKCCVRFDTLSGAQKKELEYFIENYTVAGE